MLNTFIIGSRVWIAQTNFPEETGVARTYTNKAIVLVRNPVDCIYAHFCMLATRDVEKKLTQEEFEGMQEQWEKFVEQELEIWRDFHDYWLIEPIIPTYIVRYEDLLTAPYKTLLGMFKFLLNVKDLSSTLIDSLLKQECDEDNKDYYKQKKPFYAIDKYTEDQLKFIRTHAGQTLLRLGYVEGVYGEIEQITKTDYFENSDLEESSKYEKETILRNTTETPVTMRYTFDDLNNVQLKLVAGEEYHEKLDRGKLDSIEINLDIENIRKKGPTEKSARKILRKH